MRIWARVFPACAMPWLMIRVTSAAVSTLPFFGATSQPAACAIPSRAVAPPAVTGRFVPLMVPGPSRLARLNKACTPRGPAFGPKLWSAIPPRLIRAAALIWLICCCSDLPDKLPARAMIDCGAPVIPGRATLPILPGTKSVWNTISSDSITRGALTRSCWVCDATGTKPCSKLANPNGPGKNAPMPAIN